MSGEGKIYTWAEVGQHNTEKDLWVVINDGVYDLTSYADEHPGGPIVLSSKAGKSASVAFEQAAHSNNAKENVMPKYKIGTIDSSSEMAEWQKEAQTGAPNLLVTVGLVLLVLVTIYFLAA